MELYPNREERLSKKIRATPVELPTSVALIALYKV
nr:MAG TPA: hypothetical protein [Bacteriophage sp.]